MIPLYLDWAADAPKDPKYLKVFCSSAEEYYGNPSSRHKAGLSAEYFLESLREQAAGFLSLSPKELYFTSGGSEANSIVLGSIASSVQRKSGVLLISAFEHSSLYEGTRSLKNLGFMCKEISGKGGYLDIEALEAALEENINLVSIMAVNNELGTVQPVKTVRELLDKRFKGKKRPHFHIDAVQAAGKIEPSLWAGIGDSFSISGHKLGAPRGSGILYFKGSPNALIKGGGQERGIRGGTENIASIAATVEALKDAASQLEYRRTEGMLRKILLVERLSRLSGCVILPSPEAALSDSTSPFILTAAFPPLPSEAAVRILSDAGFYVGSGSACSSKQTKQSGRVMAGLGMEKSLIPSVLRISYSHTTPTEGIESFCKTLGDTVIPLMEKLRSKKRGI